MSNNDQRIKKGPAKPPMRSGDQQYRRAPMQQGQAQAQPRPHPGGEQFMQHGSQQFSQNPQHVFYNPQQQFNMNMNNMNNMNQQLYNTNLINPNQMFQQQPMQNFQVPMSQNQQQQQSNNSYMQNVQVGNVMNMDQTVNNMNVNMRRPPMASKDTTNMMMFQQNQMQQKPQQVEPMQAPVQQQQEQQPLPQIPVQQQQQQIPVQVQQPIAPVDAPVQTTVAAVDATNVPVPSAPEETQAANEVENVKKEKKELIKPWISFRKQNPLKGFVGWARLIEIRSGDTLILEVLYEVENERKDNLIMLGLDGVKAPSLGRGNKRSKKDKIKNERIKDEPFGYIAREFVRTGLCNKRMVFFAAFEEQQSSVDVSIANVNQFKKKQLGDVYFKDKNNEWQSLSFMVVNHGYAQLHNKATNKKELAPLVKALEKAKNSKVGKWAISGDDAADEKDESAAAAAAASKYVRVLDVIDNSTGKRLQIINKYKGKTVRAIVSKVISGTQFILELVVDERNKEGNMVHPQIVANLAGVKCDYRPKPNSDDEMKINEISRLATVYSRVRLLGQYVNVCIVGPSTKDENKKIFTNVIHANGNIAKMLLSKGLAEIDEWSNSMVSQELQNGYNEASQVAKKAKTQIYSIKKAEDKETKLGVVKQVLFGDTLLISFGEEAKSEKIILSSLVLCKVMYGRAGGNVAEQNKFSKANEKENFGVCLNDAEYTYMSRETKDFLRKKLIGKKVCVVVEHKLPTGNKSFIKFANVYTVNANGNKKDSVSKILIENGFAIYRAKGQKGANYEAFNHAMEKAKAKKVGIWSKNIQIPMYLDFSSDRMPNVKKTNTIQIFNNLRTNKKLLHGVVDHVFSCNLVKVDITVDKKCSICVPLMLKGVRATSDWLNIDKSKQDNVKEQGRNYLLNKLIQKDVKVRLLEIKKNTTTARGGGGGATRSYISEWKFVGELFCEKENIIEDLLANGYVINADLDAPERLLKKETDAKANKRGLWQYHKDEVKEDGKEDESANIGKYTNKTLNVIVSHVRSATQFYFNREQDTQALNKIIQVLSQLPKESKVKNFTPKKQVAAFYEGCYARARLLGDVRNGKVLVNFVDYGNNSQVEADLLRELPEEIALGKIQPLAWEGVLAYVEPPADTGLFRGKFENAGFTFAKLCGTAENKVLKMKVFIHQIGRRHVADRFFVELFDGKNESINSHLVGAGLAKCVKPKSEWSYVPREFYFPSRKDVADYVAGVKALQEKAVKSRIGMWEHGNVDDSDEDVKPTGARRKRRY